MEARFQPPLFNIKVVDGSNGIVAYESVPLGGSVPSQYQGAGGGSNGSVGAGAGTGEPFKRKRGRPRKYGPDGKVILAVNPVSAGPAAPPTTGAFSAAANAAATAAAEGVKKARGRPQGSSKKKQLEALGSAGAGFIPHVITVKIGEGRFEILSLSGSFLLSESGGQRSRTGGLSVSLAGPDGHVLGGGVEGLLTAASPVQIIVGSFTAEGKKEPEQAHASEPASGSGKLLMLGETVGTINPLTGSYSA
ncbi:hypothetical protein C4D60_Mb07t06810 [Musa balbisiana]|uniref:AT-hook motif nuclear-localized protein n=1 Tax=Musa balbisiana TaxID=52838 RepID=A0A4S8JDN5_MUSBA|nr:hypothetical protein C4D60_Mb07t06810 [Musa balbisiana]